MEMLSQISKKYNKHYFDLQEKIKKGTKVIYIPDYHSFIYMYYEGDYARFNLKPGDVMTVKLVRKDELCYSVYVYEDKGVFSPAELLPVEVVDKEDIKRVRDFYRKYSSKHKL